MSKFNIKRHILDHAHNITDNLSHEGKLVHFNASIHTAYFIVEGHDTQEKIDAVMVNILNKLLITEYGAIEKNGFYTNKKGIKKKKKDRTRIIKFVTLLLAYHNRHFDDSKAVKPHIHILGSSKARLGKNFIYLRKALEQIAQEIQLKFHFMEERQKTGLSRHQQQAIKRISWLLNQGDMAEITKYFKKENQLEEVLDWLIIHYQSTLNISFLIKTLLVIHERLRELNIDYMYNDLNLKESIFFFLTEEQVTKLNKIQNGEVVKIYMSQELDREILIFAYGFKSDVMNILVVHFNIKIIDKDKLLVITDNHDDDKEIKGISKSKEVGFRDLVIMDIRNTLSFAKTYKSWKSALSDMDYKKVSLKTQTLTSGKRQNIGLNITTLKKTNMYIPFHQLDINHETINNIFKHNTKKNKKPKKYKSQIIDYKKKSVKLEKYNLNKFEYKVEILLEVYCYTEEAIIHSHPPSHMNKKYSIKESELYNITTYTNNTTTIVDYGDCIKLKISTDIDKSIKDIAALIKSKDWDLDKLKISGVDQCIKKLISLHKPIACLQFEVEDEHPASQIPSPKR